MTSALADVFTLDETDALLLALGPVLRRYRDTAERREALALQRALRLALDLETFEAIVRGEIVPRNRLDPGWAKAYAIR